MLFSCGFTAHHSFFLRNSTSNLFLKGLRGNFLSIPLPPIALWNTSKHKVCLVRDAVMPTWSEHFSSSICIMAKILVFFPQKNLHQTFHSKLFLSSMKFQSPENLPCERDALTKQFSSPPTSANKFSYVHVSRIFFDFQLDIQRSVFPTTSQA